MATQDNTLKQINKSGFPFQLKVEHEIRRTQQEHNWSVASREHPWSSMGLQLYQQNIRHVQYPARIIGLQLREVKFAAETLERAVDSKCTTLKVYVLPAQAKSFASP